MLQNIEQLLKKYESVKLDLGCGANKNPGFIGIDYEAFSGVDIVHDLEKFPWPLPDECASLAVSSHLVEHLNPHSGDSRVLGLLQLLLDKGVISREEVEKYIGEMNPGPRFIRFMDEVWRVLKPGGEYAMVYPYAGSPGFWQDPTHINGINEMTWWYFDPEEPRTQGALYAFYKPRPWKIKRSLGQKGGNMEVVLEKRPEKDEYKGMNPAVQYEKSMEKAAPTIDQR